MHACVCVCVCVYSKYVSISLGSQVASVVKNPPAMHETRVLSLDWEDPLEEGMAIHSLPWKGNILAWKIPRTEEHGRLWFMESQRVRHNWAHMHHTALNFS